MNNIKKVVRNIQFYFRDKTINKRYRDRLNNYDFSIICSDCIGGVICKDLRVRMNSPTRNFYFNADDYIKFCENLDYYLSLDPTPFNGTYNGEGKQYLMASLGDLKLFLVHYSSIEQLREEWNRRKTRINRDNMFFIMNDRNFCTQKEIEDFDRLPYRNKICFTHIPWPQYKSTFYIKGSENADFLKTVTDYIHKLGVRRYYDQFDFVSWINKSIDS